MELRTISALSCHIKPTINHPAHPIKLKIISKILGTSSTDLQATANKIIMLAPHLIYQVIPFFGVTKLI
jgi:hypothetical protein